MGSIQLFLLLSSGILAATASPGILPYTGINRDRGWLKLFISESEKSTHTVYLFSDSPCGETRLNLKEGDHGYFASPSYPNAYRGGLDCEYRYEVILPFYLCILSHEIISTTQMSRHRAEGLFFYEQGEPGTVIQATVFDLTLAWLPMFTIVNERFQNENL